MDRREYIRAVASIPVASRALATTVTAEDETEEEEEWSVRGVWKRRDGTGILNIRESGEEVEFETYNEWVTTTIERVSEESNTSHVVDLFDFRLISLYDGGYARSHFAHDNGLEVTIKREPHQDVEWTAYVTHIAEKWEDHREYASSSQIRLARKLKQERDRYLAD